MQKPAIFKLAFSGNSEDRAFLDWRDEVGRQLLRCDYESKGSGRVEIEHRIHVLSHMAVGRISATPLLARRGRELIERDSSDMVIVFCASGNVGVQQKSDPLELRRGAFTILDVTQPNVGELDGSTLALRLDRRRVAQHCRNVEDLFGKPHASDHTMLLLRYLEIVTELEPTLDAAAFSLVEQHVVDLLGLALGATGDAAEMATRGGLRAVRAAAIRHAIAARLQDPGLSLTSLALEFRISERYVQLIFEGMGTSFTQYLLEQRLQLAHRMLRNPALDHWRISDIAFGAGFGDLSHFNRAFRRAFGDTPTALRLAARHLRRS